MSARRGRRSRGSPGRNEVRIDLNLPAVSTFAATSDEEEAGDPLEGPR